MQAENVEDGAPAMSIAVSRQMGSVKASRVFLNMKPMMEIASVSSPCKELLTLALAII